MNKIKYLLIWFSIVFNIYFALKSAMFLFTIVKDFLFRWYLLLLLVLLLLVVAVVVIYLAFNIIFII